MSCDGEACGVVEVQWDADLAGYRISNRGDRPVMVSFSSAAGCEYIRLASLEAAVIRMSEFEPPYYADFCD